MGNFEIQRRTWRATVVRWEHLGAIGEIPDATLIILNNRLGHQYIVLKGTHYFDSGTKVTVLQNEENIILIGEGFDGFEKVLWERNLRNDPDDWGYKIDHPLEDCENAHNGKCNHWGHFFRLSYAERKALMQEQETTCIDVDTDQIYYHPWGIEKGWGYYKNNR